MKKLLSFAFCLVLFGSTFPVTVVFAAPNITVTTPNGGEALTQGATKRITWTASPEIDTVAISVVDEQGIESRITPIAGIANVGYYDWVVAVGRPNGQYKVSLTGYQTGVTNVSDTSDGYFTLAGGSSGVAQVTSPVAGAVWKLGETQHITWNAPGYDTVFLKLKTTDGLSGVITIASSIANSGGYDWVVDNKGSLLTQFTVELTAYKTGVGSVTVNSGTITIASNAQGEGGVKVLSPKGGEAFPSLGDVPVNFCANTTATTVPAGKVKVYLIQYQGATFGDVKEGPYWQVDMTMPKCPDSKTLTIGGTTHNYKNIANLKAYVEYKDASGKDILTPGRSADVFVIGSPTVPVNVPPVSLPPAPIVPTPSPAPALPAPTQPATSQAGSLYPTGTLAKEGSAVYFLVKSEAVKIPFTSWAAFIGLGYKTANIKKGLHLSGYRTSNGYTLSSPTQEHPWGSCLRRKNGAVYYSHSSGMIGIPSMAVLRSIGCTVQSMNAADEKVLNTNSQLPAFQVGDPRTL